MKNPVALWSTGVLLACMALTVAATSVLPKPLDEMVREADLVVVATIKAVSMVDGKGRPITDRRARTGPGSDNRMRLTLHVQEVLFARTETNASSLQVPLWSMWHYELGTMQDDLTGSEGIFLLKGDAHEPVYPAGFHRATQERPEIEALLGR